MTPRFDRVVELAERDGTECCYCSRELLIAYLPDPLFRDPGFVVGDHGPVIDGVMRYRATVDHVVPRAAGGTDDLENTVLSCPPCNQGKGKRSLRTYLEERMAS